MTACHALLAYLNAIRENIPKAQKHLEAVENSLHEQYNFYTHIEILINVALTHRLLGDHLKTDQFIGEIKEKASDTPVFGSFNRIDRLFPGPGLSDNSGQSNNDEINP